ncbi:FBD domain family [Hirschfeldia incana]|nr:FBD domain family [Hirschfeldia incana]
MPRMDRISALHDDLLLNILFQVPTKDAMKTMVLSKRWGSVWMMVPKLEYKDTSKERGKSVWRLVDKFLQLHKAPVLESFHIQARRQFTDDADVGKCVSYAVDHNVRELAIILPSQPKLLLLPSNFYTSKTLVNLTLSCTTFVLDVPSLACFPLLQTLALVEVVFKDECSHVRLLANCPALSNLRVSRYRDMVTRFTVKVPSLKSFTYMQGDAKPFVLDSPGLRHLRIFHLGDLGSIQNMPHLEEADVSNWVAQPNDKFLRSFSSVRNLRLSLVNVACCRAVNFSRLMKFKLHFPGPLNPALMIPGCSEFCSLEPLMLFLHNSPILKELTIRYDVYDYIEDLPLSWNQQSSVPGCLSSHLEIFLWETFGGKRRQERDCVEYILANSKCLKTATVLPLGHYNLKRKEKMVEDIKSMYRVSALSQLITHSDSTNYWNGNNLRNNIFFKMSF